MTIVSANQLIYATIHLNKRRIERTIILALYVLCLVNKGWDFAKVALQQEMHKSSLRNFVLTFLEMNVLINPFLQEQK